MPGINSLGCLKLKYDICKYTAQGKVIYLDHPFASSLA